MLISLRWAGVATALLGAPAALAGPGVPSGAAVEAAGFKPLPDKPGGRADAAIVKAEVLLARAGFSPGSIDGQDGENFHHALAAFQKRGGLPASGTFDQAVWDRLAADKGPVTARYTITAGDAKGPFTRAIPAKFEQQSRLKHLGYRTLREALAERFHMSPALLAAMNPGRAFKTGETIDVAAPNGPAPPGKAGSVVVDKTGHRVEAFGPDGTLLAAFPASIGSAEKPAPTGRFEIRRIVHHPDYTYLPQFHFKGVGSKQPFTIAPGPNNPVGAVWMDLSFEGYGIHGTPEPELIGKTQSHGCVRLTNWDAEALASLVDKGVAVTFQDGPDNPSPPPPAPAAGPPAPVSPGSAPPATPGTPTQ